MAELRERYQPTVEALQQRFGHRLRSIVLFGSQARGGARPNGDHDMFVMVEALPVEPVARQRSPQIAKKTIGAIKAWQEG